MSSDRLASRFIEAKCKELIGKRGNFIGYNTDISDDGKVVVNAFYYASDKPTVAVTLPITDKAVVRAVINPASVPQPEAKTEAQPDNGKGKK